jgi:immune inhibitor A
VKPLFGRWFRALLLMALCVQLLPLTGRATSPPVQGEFPPEITEAFEAGLFERPAPRRRHADETLRPDGADVTALTQGSWNLPVLMVSFTDQTPQFDPSLFRTLVFDTLRVNPDGSMTEYYDEVSRGALKLRGDVFGWYALPHEKNYYAADSYGIRRLGAPQNSAGLVHHVVAAADDDVDFSQYDRDGDGEVDLLFVVHTGLGAEATPSNRTNLWSITASLSSGWSGVVPYVTNDLKSGSTTQYVTVDRFCIVPELSSVHAGEMAEIGTYCHEFGHGLGWPDLYDASTLGGGSNLGPGNWCLMSTGAFGGNSQTPERPTRPSAWTLMDAGWVSADNLTETGVVSFAPVDESGVVYRLWWQGEASTEYFLLENRRRRGYDQDLPAEGLLVYRVEEEVIASRRGSNRVNSGPVPGLRLEEADGVYQLMASINRGNAGDPFPGATGNTRMADDTAPSMRSYTARYTNLELTEIREAGDRMEAWVQLNPTGWSPAEYTAVPGLMRVGSGRTLARWGSDLHLIYHDDADAGNLYCLRRVFDVSWGAPQLITTTTTSGDGTWSVPDTGPLAVLWTDRRDGEPEIYYRKWLPTPGPDVRATYSPGFATRPAGAWLPGGNMALLWLDSRFGKNLLLYKQLVEGSESDSVGVAVLQSSPVEEIIEFSLDADDQGRLFVACTGRGPNIDEIYWTYYVPGQGWAEAIRLSAFDGFPSGQPDVDVLEDGTVSVIWRDTGPTRSTVQNNLFDPVTETFLPTETPLFVSALSLSSITQAPGPGKIAGVLSRSNEPPDDRVLFAGRHADGGWDLALGWISEGLNAGGARIGLSVEDDGMITALWANQVDGASQVVTRRRLVAQASLVDVPTPAPRPQGALQLRALPNPATDVVRFVWSGGMEDATLTLYAPSGRRVAKLPMRSPEIHWRGLDDHGRTLPPSVYFYRLEDRGGAPLSRVGKLVWIP